MVINREKTAHELFEELEQLNKGKNINRAHLTRVLAVIDCIELPVPKVESNKNPSKNTNVHPKDGQNPAECRPVRKWNEEEIKKWAKDCQAAAQKRKMEKIIDQNEQKRKK